MSLDPYLGPLSRVRQPPTTTVTLCRPNLRVTRDFRYKKEKEKRIWLENFDAKYPSGVVYPRLGMDRLVFLFWTREQVVSLTPRRSEDTGSLLHVHNAPGKQELQR